MPRLDALLLAVGFLGPVAGWLFSTGYLEGLYIRCGVRKGVVSRARESAVVFQEGHI